MPVHPERYRSNSDEVAAKVIDGEAIIINLTTGVYYSLDSVGGRVWSLLEAHYDLDTITSVLEREYEVTMDDCRKDVTRLVSELVDEQLLLPTDEVPTEPASGGPGARLAYTPPEVNIYRDMGDLLALDPPVPGLEPIPWDDPARKSTSDSG